MKEYRYKGRTFNELPDPLDGTSPMTEQRFIEMGGTIADDGEPSPKERVCAAFSDLIADLAGRTDRITPEEFLQVARSGISSELIAFARERGVPEEVIAEGRARMVEIMSDALRFGVFWAELVNGAAEA